MLAIGGLASTAQAQDSGVYVNVGVDTVEFEAYTLSGKVGYNFNEYIALEGQASFGVDGFGDEAVGVDIGIDNSFAGFLKLGTEILPGLEVFARGGYHFTQFGAEGAIAGTVIDSSINRDGFAVGAGGQYFFNEKNGVRLEYTYLDVEGTGGSVLSLSYVRKF